MTNKVILCMIGKTVIVGSKNMKEKILKFITSKFFVLGIQLLATIAVVYFTFKLDLVPTKYLIAGIVVLALLLAGFFGIIYSSEQKIKKGLSSKRGIVTKIISLLTTEPNGKIEFLEIENLVEKALNKHQLVKNPTLEQLIEIDAWARNFVLKEIGED